ncbi:uncharacterized protein LOC131605502 [Vicia villosa]|uniref:uncharacterized protein LOC131605502 n=1 Tax=Vicia villosa TaxID=3911 RepID=UPI00273B4382|nr:uncharacterized protein LOC131605502 [Vicia villosa]
MAGKIFESRDKVIEWARAIGKNHGIVVVTIQSDSVNGKRERKHKLIMGCDRGGNHKKKNEVVAPSDGNSTMRLRCPFRLGSVPSGIGWQVGVKCGMHNHKIDKDMLGHDILGRLKDDERKFVNDMMKYNMAKISKNISMKCKEYVKSERQEHVMDQWNNMMYSNTEDEFDVHLNHFESVCGDVPSFVKYLKETWLTPYKERFVVAWTNIVTHLGNTTTNMVESAHWRLKNMSTTSRGDLCASWEAVNIMLKLQLGSIRVSFQKSIVNIENWYNTPFYSKLHSFVSKQCIQLIGIELERVKFVGIPIPLESIHVFWTKLQISKYEGVEEKARDIAYPSTSSICPPPVKYKPKRGAKKSIKGEESDESQTTKRSCTQLSGSQSSSMPIGKQHSTNSAKGKYLSQFPAFFHPYIDDSVNVEPDGDCGFRCISSALG